MPDWVTNTIVGVVSTLVASAILGAMVWMRLTYSRFGEMESHLATIATALGHSSTRQKRQGRQIRNHEGRISELERGKKEE